MRVGLRDGNIFGHLPTAAQHLPTAAQHLPTATQLLDYAYAQLQQLFLSAQLFIEQYEFQVEIVLDLRPLLLAY